MHVKYKPTVTIVIPAKNEELFISETLGAIRKMDYDQEFIEVLVIDNGSTDRTQKIAESYGAKVIPVSDGTVGKLRNMGAQHAKGELLAFLDADCVPKVEWLASACKILDQEDCITGCRVSRPSQSTWIERAWFYDVIEGRTEVKYINSGNMILRRTTFLSVGGFDERLMSGEDTELCMRIAKKVRIIQDSSVGVVHLGNPKSIKSFYKREIWHGMGALGTFRHKRTDKPFIATLIFIAAISLQIAGLANYMLTSKVNILLLGIVIQLLITISSTIVRLIRFDNYLMMLQVFILYNIYYYGRSYALITTALHGNKIIRSR